MFIQVATILYLIEQIKVCKSNQKLNVLSTDSSGPQSKKDQATRTITDVSDELPFVNDRSFPFLTMSHSARNKSQAEPIKAKLATLAEEAVHNTYLSIMSLHQYRERMSAKPHYRLGFITSYLGLERAKMNALFEIAVKYKENGQALQQLKVFDHILECNSNMTVLLKQLAYIHIQTREKDGRVSTTPHGTGYHITPNKDITTPDFFDSKEDIF